MYEGILKIKTLDLSNYKKPKSLRQQFIDEAFIRVNSSRIEAGFKPLKIQAIAIRINRSCKSDTDIHYFWNRCKEGNFSKVFWGATKVKEEQN